MAGLVNDWLPRPRVLRGPENPFEFDRRNVLILTFFYPMDLGSGKRIKSLCGAKPPQKLRWTNAGRWIAMGIMEILPRTLGGWADSRGSACASCVV